MNAGFLLRVCSNALFFSLNKVLHQDPNKLFLWIQGSEFFDPIWCMSWYHGTKNKAVQQLQGISMQSN